MQGLALVQRDLPLSSMPPCIYHPQIGMVGRTDLEGAWGQRGGKQSVAQEEILLMEHSPLVLH